MSAFDPFHQANHVNSKVVVSLEKLSEVFRVMLWDSGKKYGLSPIQIQLLLFVKYHPEEDFREDLRKVAYMAKEFNMTKATISDSLKTLEQKGLVRKKTDAEDARSVTISLSAKGEKIAQHISDYSDTLSGAIDKLSPTERDNLLLTLMKISRHLLENDTLSVERMCFHCANYKGNFNNDHYCEAYKKKIPQKSLRVDCPAHIEP
jgi:DNA-binding MarR family transcriptional regulator